LLKITKRTAHQ